jgi:hypothetical protein
MLDYFSKVPWEGWGFMVTWSALQNFALCVVGNSNRWRVGLWIWWLLSLWDWDTSTKWGYLKREHEIAVASKLSILVWMTSPCSCNLFCFGGQSHEHSSLFWRWRSVLFVELASRGGDLVGLLHPFSCVFHRSDSYYVQAFQSVYIRFRFESKHNFVYGQTISVHNFLCTVKLSPKSYFLNFNYFYVLRRIFSFSRNISAELCELIMMVREYCRPSIGFCSAGARCSWDHN